MQLVAAAATLVARDDLHPALGDLMMQTAAEVFHRDTLFSDVSRFPSADYLDFPLSADAERYYHHGVPFLQRFLPFWAANLIDRMKVLAVPLLALLLPLTRILPPAYRWSVRKRSIAGMVKFSLSIKVLLTARKSRTWNYASRSYCASKERRAMSMFRWAIRMSFMHCVSISIC